MTDEDYPTEVVICKDAEFYEIANADSDPSFKKFGKKLGIRTRKSNYIKTC